MSLGCGVNFFRCVGLLSSKGLSRTSFLQRGCAIPTISARLQSVGGRTEAPAKPRRAPLSAYQIFVKERLSNKIADGSQKELLRNVAVEWQSLTEDEKGPYFEKSDIEKDGWYKECAKYESYLDSLSEVQRSRIKMKELLLKADAKERRKLSKTAADDVALKMPKRPGSIFQLFLMQAIEEGSFGGLRGPELFHAAGEKWKNIPESQKEELRIQRRNLQEQYLKDLEVWKKS